MLNQTDEETIVFRRTAKISTLGAEEEMLSEISQAFNIAVEQMETRM